MDNEGGQTLDSAAMSTEFSQNSETLARARAELETRLSEVPAWRELKQLEAGGDLSSPYRSAKRQALIAQLKGNPVYQGWLEACAAMAKLAIGAARSIAPTLPAAVAEAVASAPKPGAGADVKPPSGPAPPDDLLLIRGITQTNAVALHRLGVRRFADIAAWTSADVARISAALSLGDAISRQNWIEQAAVRAPAKVAPSTPVAKPAEAKAPAAPPVAASKPEPTPASAAPEPAAGDDLTRIRGITPAIAAGLRQLGETSFAHIANWTAADVERVTSALGVGEAIRRQSWIEQAAMRVPASALRTSSPAPAVAAPAVPPSPARAAPQPAPAPEKKSEVPAAPKPDDLTAIRVVTPSLAKKLHVIGVTAFDDIANWSSLDVGRVSGILDIGDKISREAWIEQAAMRVLRRGGVLKPPAAVARPPKPVSAAAPEPQSAASAAPAPVVAAAPAPAPAPAPAAPLVPPAFATALAAIKAELATPPPAPETPSDVVAPAPAIAKPAPVAPAVPAVPDDLTRIGGITPLLAKQLNVIGVSRFAEIAGWSAADVARVRGVLDAGDRIGRQGWIEQAAVLARGGMTAFAARAAAGYGAATVALPPPPLAPLPRAEQPATQAPPEAAPVAPLAVAAPPASAATALDSALDGLQAIADAAIARTPPPISLAPPAAGSLSAAPAHPGVQGVDAAIAELQAIADEAAARSAARVPPPSLVASAPPEPAPLPVASAAEVALPPPLPGAEMPPPVAPVQQWPRMTNASPHPAPVVAAAPPVAVNDMPGPAEPPPAAPRPAQPEPMSTEPPPLPSLRGLEGGLAAALAAAAATASATPRLTPGRLSDQIRSLPPVGSDPYLEDLSDWVQDAAADLPPHAAADHGPALPGGEAEVAIMRSETVVGDLGAVTPGADHFDAASYSGYRREVHEASVEIVGARLELPASPASDSQSGGGKEAERGLKRLMRVFRGDPSQR